MPISKSTALQTSGAAVMLPAQQQAQAAAIADAMTSGQGLSNLSNGGPIDAFPMPSSLSVTISSNADAGGANTPTNIFNNSYLTPAATTNGSGAGSIATQFGDAFNGRVYEQLAKAANMARGIKITGFTIIASNFTSGAQVNTPFNTINMSLLVANGQGQLIPFPIKLQEAVRNTQYQSGTLTPVVPFSLNCLCQIQVTIPPNTNFAFTFFTDASSFAG